MDETTAFEAQLAARLRADAARGVPAIDAATFAEVALRAPRARHRPLQWLFRSAVPRRAIALLVVVGLLIISLVAGLLIAGSRARPAPLRGLAGNGLLAYEVRNKVYVARSDGSSPRLAGWGILPAFSPDGSRLAYFGGNLGHLGVLYVIDVAQIGLSDPTRVSGSVDIKGEPRAPAWSSDGTRLAFTAAVESLDGDAAPQVFVAWADGSSEPRAVTSGSLWHHSPAWSPDGSWIAFAAQTPNPGGAEADSPPLEGTIGIVHPDGSGAHQLAGSVTHGAGFGRIVAWAPDSNGVLFDRPAFTVPNQVDPARWELVVTGLDGGQRIVAMETADFFLHADWSSDGRWIAYELPQLGRLRVLQASTAEVVLERELSSGTCDIKWSPDNRFFLNSCLRFTQLLPVPDNLLASVACPRCPPQDPIDVALPDGAIARDWQRIAP